MLTLLISRLKQPENDIDIYLASLINDLKIFWSTRVKAYDAYREESFMLRAMLMWTINEFSAYGNLSGYRNKGYNICSVCAVHD